jgi:hypothetical protein
MEVLESLHCPKQRSGRTVGGTAEIYKHTFVLTVDAFSELYRIVFLCLRMYMSGCFHWHL